MIDAADLRWLAAFCNALPFVRWDRLVRAPLTEVPQVCDADGGVRVEMYGWIDRDDGRSDFVILYVRLPERAIGYTSSSAERTQEIRDRLFGHLDEPTEHYACERVEDVFGDLVPGAIRL